MFIYQRLYRYNFSFSQPQKTSTVPSHLRTSLRHILPSREVGDGDRAATLLQEPIDLQPVADFP